MYNLRPVKFSSSRSYMNTQAAISDRRDTGVTFMDQVDAPRQDPDGPFGLFKCIRAPPVVEVFAKHACDMDILQLLTTVNRRVADCFQTSCSASYKQVRT
ncbi:hypothetical protein ANCCEY_14979 [Ancylostoma ceylanicum]|uniref:Caspase family p10 domain-containing protein n=1 Tax=Ancylostoma ceylanicum TaxID=53326 RepID=A0A0D6L4M8_9BILA|nr:hypothetical protein ANCCEY_14979 [Ancylostoma ceylanicum]